MGARIFFLDDSEDLRALMARLVKAKLGEDCLCLNSVKDLIANKAEVPGSRIAILDINLGIGEQTGLDAFFWLQDQGYKGSIFFLTGHARSHPLITKACDSGAKVWAKPVQTNQIFSTMSEILANSGKPS